MSKRNISRIRTCDYCNDQEINLVWLCLLFSVNAHYDIHVTFLIECLKQCNRGIKDQTEFSRTQYRMLIIDTFQRNDKHFSISSKTRNSMVWKRVAHILYHSIGCSSISQICLKWGNRNFSNSCAFKKSSNVFYNHTVNIQLYIKL